jgi:sulfite exporter TauE/SafE
MSLIPDISNPYLGAFAGGLLYGLAVCTASCLPYVSSYIAGVGAGFKRGVKLTLIFSSGRIVAYALIGGLIGLFAGLFQLAISAETLSPFQIYSSLAFAFVSIAIGASILIKSRKP